MIGRLILIIVVSVGHLAAEEVSFPRAMAALGDSISEALFSDFSLEHPPTTSQIMSMLKLAKQAKDQEERRVLFRARYAKPSHSWSTGQDESDFVLSHYERIKDFVPSLQAYNFAVSGSQSKELGSQVSALLDVENEKGIDFDYVTLMIGSNDLRGDSLEELSTPDVFLNNVGSALRRLLDANPDRRVLVVGLPSIHSIFESSSDIIALSLWTGAYTCADIREQIYGPMVIFKKENTEPYDLSKILAKQYDDGLGVLVMTIQEQYPRAALRFVRDYGLPLKQNKSLSLDCFHPSPWGQAEIAEATWNRGFWPRTESLHFDFLPFIQSSK